MDWACWIWVVIGLDLGLALSAITIDVELSGGQLLLGLVTPAGLSWLTFWVAWLHAGEEAPRPAHACACLVSSALRVALAALTLF